MSRIGTLVKADRVADIRTEFAKMKGYGFDVLQISVWDTSRYTEEFAAEILDASRQSDIPVDALWAGWSGECEWNFSKGPDTIGLVPERFRGSRVEELKKAADFAKTLGVPYVITHVGFLPDKLDTGLICAIREVAKYCKSLGLEFLFEMGQETPEVLLSAINVVGLSNLGVNLDTANIILYGKGNPADAVNVLGEYVKCTHVKDGFYPTDTESIGREAKVGEGMADIPEVIRRLKKAGYCGDYIIEREIRDKDRLKDVLEAKAYLEKLTEETR